MLTAEIAGVSGGRFDFDDGGSFCGGWEDGKAHGYGVCTGPKGQGVFKGAWHYGFEVSGVYTWPSGSTYAGLWQSGRRHGLGVESRGKWVYKGEWTQGFKGRYGLRQSVVTNAKYQGTWANGLQDGYGSEVYGDGGTYQGQWLRGMRHGYGVRTSAPFGVASQMPRPKLTEEAPESTESKETAKTNKLSRRSASEEDSATEMRGGFVLRSRSDEFPQRRRSLGERSGMRSIVQNLKLKKQRSTGDIDRKGVSSLRSTGSTTSWMSAESNNNLSANRSEASSHSFILEEEHLDESVTETYMGEWKNDRRTGFGVCERSDGLRYEGEWYNNRKYGYGVTTFGDGSKEEGKYKNNQLISSSQRRHLFLIRSAKFRERIDSAINAAQRASKIAVQKADIAMSRTATARGKADHADVAKEKAMDDADMAETCAKKFETHPSREASPANNTANSNNLDLPNSNILNTNMNLAVPHNNSNNLAMNTTNNLMTRTSVSESLTMTPRRQESAVHSEPKENVLNKKALYQDMEHIEHIDDVDGAMSNEDFKAIVARATPKARATPEPSASRVRSDSRATSGRSASASRPWGASDAGLIRPPLERQHSDPRRILADRMDHYRRSVSREPSIETGRRSADRRVFDHISNNDIIVDNVVDNENVDDTLRRRRNLDVSQRRKRSFGQGRSTRVEMHDTASQTVEADVRLTNVSPPVRQPSLCNDRKRNSIDALRAPLIEVQKQQQSPLANLVSPRAQALVSRQQLMVFVLLVNLSLAVLFFKLLT